MTPIPDEIHRHSGSTITYLDVLKKDLKLMDMTAITLCRENHLPILVFNMNRPGNFKRLILGEPVGTRVSEAL
jgi:uridylate kinase